MALVISVFLDFFVFLLCSRKHSFLPHEGFVFQGLPTPLEIMFLQNPLPHSQENSNRFCEWRMVIFMELHSAANNSWVTEEIALLMYVPKSYSENNKA